MRTPRIAHRSTLARAGAIVAAAALGTTLSAGAAFADDSLSVLDVGLTTDYVGDSTSLMSEDSLPSAVDLRHFGGTVTFNTGDKQSTITGGWSYVTPVKCQDPFGSCWSFAASSASETSMISALDRADDGLLNGSFNYTTAKESDAGTLANNVSNLSERHLAYFAFSHPAIDSSWSSQAGEGQYLTDGTNDDAAIMKAGGQKFTAKAIYSSGIGPVPESVAPYRSDESWYQVYALRPNAAGTDLDLEYFLSLDAAKAYLKATWTTENVAAFNEKYGTSLSVMTGAVRIGGKGTWSVDTSKTYQVIAELDNSNMLPTEKENYTLTATELTEIKQELNDGRAISLNFRASQSQPGQVVKADDFMNTDNWAQYNFSTVASDIQMNHAVCIVGYDDNYSASNFTHTAYKKDANGLVVYQKDGVELTNNPQTRKPIDPATGEDITDTSSLTPVDNTAATTPPGDGAFIVKNSWGSKDNENELYEKDWGIDGSGYFYLSYYDHSITSMESFEYDLSDEAQTRSEYVCYQYDMAKLGNESAEGSATLLKTANVFQGPEEGESTIAVRDVSCETGSLNDTVTMDVYVMDDNADVTATLESSKPSATVTDTFEDTGFHRLHLDTPVIVNPNQKFVVVQTTKRTNGEYEELYAYGNSQEIVNAYAPLQKIPNYTVTVINEGESLVYKNGAWTDWTVEAAAMCDANTKQQSAQYAAMAQQFEAAGQTELAEIYNNLAAVKTAFVTDNVLIKAYADEVKDVTKVFSDVEAGQWYTDSIQRVYGLGLMSGYKSDGNPTGLFGTHDTLTRAQAVAVLYNMAGKGATFEGSKFSDVASDSWCAQAVTWAAEQGIVSGYDDGRFGPDDQVTREQLAAMLQAMAQKGLISIPTTYNENALATFPDASSVSSWASEAMKWAVTQGVISGAEVNGARYLQPQTSSERCVMAAMVSNVLDLASK